MLYKFKKIGIFLFLTFSFIMGILLIFLLPLSSTSIKSNSFLEEYGIQFFRKKIQNSENYVYNQILFPKKDPSLSNVHVIYNENDKKNFDQLIENKKWNLDFNQKKFDHYLKIQEKWKQINNDISKIINLKKEKNWGLQVQKNLNKKNVDIILYEFKNFSNSDKKIINEFLKDLKFNDKKFLQLKKSDFMYLFFSEHFPSPIFMQTFIENWKSKINNEWEFSELKFNYDAKKNIEYKTTVPILISKKLWENKILFSMKPNLDFQKNTWELIIKFYKYDENNKIDFENNNIMELNRPINVFFSNANIQIDDPIDTTTKNSQLKTNLKNKFIFNLDDFKKEENSNEEKENTKNYEIIEKFLNNDLKKIFENPIFLSSISMLSDKIPFLSPWIENLKSIFINLKKYPDFLKLNNKIPNDNLKKLINEFKEKSNININQFTKYIEQLDYEKIIPTLLSPTEKIEKNNIISKNKNFFLYLFILGINDISKIIHKELLILDPSIALGIDPIGDENENANWEYFLKWLFKQEIFKDNFFVLENYSTKDIFLKLKNKLPDFIIYFSENQIEIPLEIKKIINSILPTENYQIYFKIFFDILEDKNLIKSFLNFISNSKETKEHFIKLKDIFDDISAVSVDNFWKSFFSQKNYYEDTEKLKQEIEVMFTKFFNIIKNKKLNIPLLPEIFKLILQDETNDEINNNKIKNLANIFIENYPEDANLYQQTEWLRKIIKNEFNDLNIEKINNVLFKKTFLTLFPEFSLNELPNTITDFANISLSTKTHLKTIINYFIKISDSPKIANALNLSINIMEQDNNIIKLFLNFIANSKEIAKQKEVLTEILNSENSQLFINNLLKNILTEKTYDTNSDNLKEEMKLLFENIFNILKLTESDLSNIFDLINNNNNLLNIIFNNDLKDFIKLILKDKTQFVTILSKLFLPPLNNDDQQNDKMFLLNQIIQKPDLFLTFSQNKLKKLYEIFYILFPDFALSQDEENEILNQNNKNNLQLSIDWILKIFTKINSLNQAKNSKIIFNDLKYDLGSNTIYDQTKWKITFVADDIAANSKYNFVYQVSDSIEKTIFSLTKTELIEYSSQNSLAGLKSTDIEEGEDLSPTQKETLLTHWKKLQAEIEENKLFIFKEGNQAKNSKIIFKNIEHDLGSNIIYDQTKWKITFVADNSKYNFVYQVSDSIEKTIFSLTKTQLIEYLSQNSLAGLKSTDIVEGEDLSVSQKETLLNHWKKLQAEIEENKLFIFKEGNEFNTNSINSFINIFPNIFSFLFFEDKNISKLINDLFFVNKNFNIWNDLFIKNEFSTTNQNNDSLIISFLQTIKKYLNNEKIIENDAKNIWKIIEKIIKKNNFPDISNLELVSKKLILNLLQKNNFENYSSQDFKNLFEVIENIISEMDFNQFKNLKSNNIFFNFFISLLKEKNIINKSLNQIIENNQFIFKEGNQAKNSKIIFKNIEHDLGSNTIYDKTKWKITFTLDDLVEANSKYNFVYQVSDGIEITIFSPTKTELIEYSSQNSLAGLKSTDIEEGKDLSVSQKEILLNNLEKFNSANSDSLISQLVYLMTQIFNLDKTSWTDQNYLDYGTLIYESIYEFASFYLKENFKLDINNIFKTDLENSIKSIISSFLKNGFSGFILEEGNLNHDFEIGNQKIKEIDKIIYPILTRLTFDAFVNSNNKALNKMKKMIFLKNLFYKIIIKGMNPASQGEENNIFDDATIDKILKYKFNFLEDFLEKQLRVKTQINKKRWIKNFLYGFENNDHGKTITLPFSQNNKKIQFIKWLQKANLEKQGIAYDKTKWKITFTLDDLVAANSKYNFVYKISDDVEKIILSFTKEQLENYVSKNPLSHFTETSYWGYSISKIQEGQDLSDLQKIALLDHWNRPEAEIEKFIFKEGNQAKNSKIIFKNIEHDLGSNTIYDQTKWKITFTLDNLVEANSKYNFVYQVSGGIEITIFSLTKTQLIEYYSSQNYLAGLKSTDIEEGEDLSVSKKETLLNHWKKLQAEIEENKPFIFEEGIQAKNSKIRFKNIEYNLGSNIIYDQTKWKITFVADNSKYNFVYQVSDSIEKTIFSLTKTELIEYSSQNSLAGLKSTDIEEGEDLSPTQKETLLNHWKKLQAEIEENKLFIFKEGNQAKNSKIIFKEINYDLGLNLLYDETKWKITINDDGLIVIKYDEKLWNKIVDIIESFKSNIQDSVSSDLLANAYSYFATTTLLKEDIDFIIINLPGALNSFRTRFSFLKTIYKNGILNFQKEDITKIYTLLKNANGSPEKIFDQSFLDKFIKQINYEDDFPQFIYDLLSKPWNEIIKNGLSFINSEENFIFFKNQIKKRIF